MPRRTVPGERLTWAVMPGLIALVITLTTACSPGAPQSDVTVAQLQERSEKIGQSLTATIDGVDRYQDDVSGGGEMWENAEANDDDPNGWRYWQWNAAIVLAPDAELTPQQAADRMIEFLEEDGWTADEPVVGTGSDRLGFRKSDDLGDSWYTEITFWKDPPPDPQNLFVTVVSPSTNRP